MNLSTCETHFSLTAALRLTDHTFFLRSHSSPALPGQTGAGRHCSPISTTMATKTCLWAMVTEKMSPISILCFSEWVQVLSEHRRPVRNDFMRKSQTYP